jgi:hypothetical protein
MSTAPSPETTIVDQAAPDDERLAALPQPERPVLRGYAGESDDDSSGEYAYYRALSPAAVVACVLGVASALAFFDWWLAAVPLAGITAGMFALRQIGQRRDELTGRIPAATGLVLSGVCLLGGQSRLWYVHLTEVPDGHIRISYEDLQPPERSVIPISDEAREFNGQRVFIKGYVLAGNLKDGIRTFILVRDKGDCCFGGNPKLTDRILVQLKPGRTFTYTDRLQKLAGRFHVRPGRAVDVDGDVVYQLDDADLL